jgi:putative phosphoesterase
MKIGVLSDTHGRLEMTRSAIHLLCERGAELILHCGDIDSPATVRLFSEVPTHFVFGNWDLRPAALRQAIGDARGILHDGHGRLEVAGKRLVWLHGHVRGERQRLEASGEFDFLFYGHSHKAEAHQTGRTVVINPGALYRAKTKSVALVDVEVGYWVHLKVGEE